MPITTTLFKPPHGKINGKMKDRKKTEKEKQKKNSK